MAKPAIPVVSPICTVWIDVWKKRHIAGNVGVNISLTNEPSALSNTINVTKNQNTVFICGVWCVSEFCILVEGGGYSYIDMNKFLFHLVGKDNSASRHFLLFL